MTSATTFICPRCAHVGALRAEMRFCPHCGLPGAAEAFLDAAPIDLPTDDGRTARVFERFEYGSVCTLYRCRIRPTAATGFAAGEVEAVLKLARDARTNDLVAHEAAVLRRLHAAPDADRFAPFLPAVEATAWVRDDPAAPPRRANVLGLDRLIPSPVDDLSTLAQVRAHHRAGLDPRDMAWVWRRLLPVLGFAHDAGVVHGAVLPMHVLIEPREHKLVLVDWCCAAIDPARTRTPLLILTGGSGPWYDPAVRRGAPPTPGLDIAMAARCMIELTGGDPVHGRFPAGVDASLQRYFDRCLAAADPGNWSNGAAGSKADARRLLADFDRLIEILWGPRRFRPLDMPPRRRADAAVPGRSRTGG
jgi:hypothetical protein